MAVFVATQRRHGPGILLSRHHVAQRHRHSTPYTDIGDRTSYLNIHRTYPTPQCITNKAEEMQAISDPWVQALSLKDNPSMRCTCFWRSHHESYHELYRDH
jgi:hypothetical protein